MRTNLFIETIRPFVVFFGRFKKKNRDKIKEVVSEYEDLLEEYRLIELGESELSSTKRKHVKARVVHLISKGHIKIK